MNLPKRHSNTQTPFYLLFAAVLAFFFVSGACGLLYQVVWTRKLVLLFGTTAYAVSTVLSIFFLGLGLGSLWGGRLADRHRHPLRLYGFFEIAIGVWALLFILGVSVGEDSVVAVLKTFGAARSASIVLRALMAFFYLFVPVLLMGATLPLLAKFVNREAHVRGLPIGALYTLNTFGAVAGCCCTGFFLLERLGYTNTTLLGAAANGLIGLLAMAASFRYEKAPTTEKTNTDGTAHEAYEMQPGHVRSRGLVLAAFAISGFCALALEVLWTRLLVIVFLGTTYAYTAMLTTLLCGIALGSAVASLFVDRLKRPMFALGIVMMLSGAGALLTLAGIAGLPERVLELHRDSGNNWAPVLRGKFFYSFLVLFLPTFFSGMTFPLVVKTIGRSRERLGHDVGRLYGANTFGGVLGALAGGYCLIPLFGTHNGILALSLLLGLTGAAVLLTSSTAPPSVSRKPLLKGMALALGALVLALAWWGAPADVSLALNAGYIPEDHRLIHYREGVEGTIAVSEPKEETQGTNRVLWINRVQATASIEKGVKMNRLQGVLPLLFDRDPHEVLFMCFGSGITCGTLALADFERIDAVEISSDVFEAAPLFAADNLGVLDRPNVNFIVDDGRNFLLTTDNTYDVITFEPMPLALAGVSTFYTQEYYRLCLDRLKPRGLVSQWVPLHSLNPEVVRSLVYTFTTAFPDYCAWFVNADLFLIGSNKTLKLDYGALSRRLADPALKNALDEVGLCDVTEVIACFLMDHEALDTYAKGGDIMCDDRPWAEFVAPRLVYERTVQDSLREIAPYVRSPLPLFLWDGLEDEAMDAIARRHQSRTHDLIGLQAYYGGMTIGSEAADRFKESLRIDPGNCTAKYYLKQIIQNQAETFLGWEEYDKVKAMLTDTLTYLPGDTDLLLLLADACHATGATEEARQHYQHYRSLGGNEARAHTRSR